MKKQDSIIINKINNILNNMNINISSSIINFIYSLYLYELDYNPTDTKLINQDRVIFSKKEYEILSNIMMHLSSNNINLDMVTRNKISLNNTFDKSGSSLAVSTSLALSNKLYNKLKFNVFNIINMNDLISGLSYESLNFANYNNIDNLIIVYEKEDIKTFKENLVDRFLSLDIEYIKVKDTNNINSIITSIKKAKEYKGISVIELNSKNKTDISNNSKFDENDYNYVRGILSKRLKLKSNEDIFNNLDEYKFFLDNKTLVQIDSNNYKLSDNYNERNTISNDKFENIFLKKNNLIKTIGDNKIVDTNGRKLINAYLSIGLSKLNINNILYINLSDIPYYLNEIEYICNNNLCINFVFINDNIDNIKYIDNIENLYLFKPYDVKEIIGYYELISRYEKNFGILINDEQQKISKYTNSKYSQIGAYPIINEKEKLDGIILSSSSNINKAININEKLYKYHIDTRVVNLTSYNIFIKQNDNYINRLLPKDKLLIIIDDYNNMNYNVFNNNILYIDNSYNNDDVILVNIIERINKK